MKVSAPVCGFTAYRAFIEIVGTFPAKVTAPASGEIVAIAPFVTPISCPVKRSAPVCVVARIDIFSDATAPEKVKAPLVGFAFVTVFIVATFPVKANAPGAVVIAASVFVAVETVGV